MTTERELAELASDEIGYECSHVGVPDESVPGGCPECWDLGMKVADAILAAGYRKPREIPDEMLLGDENDFPDDMIVRSADGSVWRVEPQFGWDCVTEGDAVLRGPATVLHEGTRDE